ncbi:type II toxin-antitoxin system RelE family toxin [Agrobacterium salinitolerans]|uniref:type II toxin-antitoxin system RelE family toxin n=1 Tax=Agrobacterium TaxID=357 RepID=UPI00174961CF|nr:MULTISPECIES: type II toxin-antitoxin system RelE/ParE family toxin [Agrobacterium]MBA4777021.1 type II toxin-antitoxin system RelE/ParE family toxin [Hyphomicrobiales bacterium]MCZ7860039.1 type II toxin-antitoxin system RelE/ParE family toxin [Agrobacterium salinitolerans]MCZ7885206.1 type II toxin-antitoxin system RelE/ParE family toxin [Agrobacterium salinitolerans]MDA5628514.1 type II toxin-antitoxin system RelE/ParE family toxin [Agrobacterium sp. ST15.16.055]MDA6978750.1 type II toxi
MIWRIEFQRNAVKQLGKLTKSDANRIVSFLTDRVAQDDNPRRTGAALQGSELGNFWRYRVGDYRIICDIQDHKLVVLVVEIGHRREIYR